MELHYLYPQQAAYQEFGVNMKWRVVEKEEETFPLPAIPSRSHLCDAHLLRPRPAM